MANAEVAGFSRQRIVQNFAGQRNVGFDGASNRMQVGMGADWSNVHQIRNEFLDINFRNNVSRLNFYSTKVQAGVMIETILGELHGANNFQGALNRIWYSIQELTAHPDGHHTRQFFLANVNTFLVNAQTVYNDLFEYQQNLDAQIREVVYGSRGINATVSAIGELNVRIRFLEKNGDMANDYRDQRNLLVDHLATLIPIHVRHADNGDMNITSMGHHILTGNSASPLGLRNIARESNFVIPVFTHETDVLPSNTPPEEFTSFINFDRPINAANSNDNGKLFALIQARGTAPKNHLSADVLPPLTLAELNDAIAQISADVAGGMTIGDALEAFELANPGILNRDIPGFIPQIVAAIDAGNAALVAELEEEMARNVRAQMFNHAAHMWSVENAKIPQVMMNLDRIVNTVVTKLNDALTGNLRGPDGNFLFYETDAAGNPLIPDPLDIDPVTNEPRRVPVRPRDLNGEFGIPLFVRQTDEALPSADRVWPVDPPQDPNRATTIFTINNIRLNPDFRLDAGHNHLALSLSGAPGDTDLLVALQEVWMDASSFYAVEVGGRQFNVQDAYIRLTGMVATETAEAASRVTTGTIQVDQAQNQRMSVKGVSMDEEMAAMLRFQFAFQAASRVFNMIDQMIDRVVNGTGRVGL